MVDVWVNEDLTYTERHAMYLKRKAKLAKELAKEKGVTANENEPSSNSSDEEIVVEPASSSSNNEQTKDSASKNEVRKDQSPQDTI